MTQYDVVGEACIKNSWNTSTVVAHNLQASCLILLVAQFLKKKTQKWKNTKKNQHQNTYFNWEIIIYTLGLVLMLT